MFDIGSAVRVCSDAGEVPEGTLGLIVGKVDDHGATDGDPLFMVMGRGKKDVYWSEELKGRND